MTSFDWELRTHALSCPPYAKESIYENIIPRPSLRFSPRRASKHLKLNMSKAKFIHHLSYQFCSSFYVLCLSKDPLCLSKLETSFFLNTLHPVLIRSYWFYFPDIFTTIYTFSFQCHYPSLNQNPLPFRPLKWSFSWPFCLLSWLFPTSTLNPQSLPAASMILRKCDHSKRIPYHCRHWSGNSRSRN